MSSDFFVTYLPGCSPDPAVTLTVPAKRQGDFTDSNEPPPKSPPPGEPQRRSRNEETSNPTLGADPVNLFTGEFFLEKVDFELPSVGFPFTFVRTYKSGRPFFGPFGYNWDHNYNVYLRELNDGRIAVNSGYLQEDIYTDSGDSIVYDSPRGVFAILERQSAQSTDEFILTFADRKKWYFGRPSGWSNPERIPLTRIEDAHGNSQQLVYNNIDQLSQVIDTVRRKINFIYGSCDLLEALQPDFLQTPGASPVEIKYLHANNIEHLSGVVTFPTSDFPNGLLTCYEYDEEQPLPEQRGNVTRVTDAKGQTIVENFYGTDTSDDSFNRVVKQHFQGGEYLFKYTNIRYLPPLDEYINDAFVNVEHYEPERPLKVYTFNFRGNLLDERFRLCADGSYRVRAQSYRYNKDGQLIELHHANGIAEYFTYDETNPDPFGRANLLKVELKSSSLPLAISRTLRRFTYDPVYQKVKTAADEDGNLTRLSYDFDRDPTSLNFHGKPFT